MKTTVNTLRTADYDEIAVAVAIAKAGVQTLLDRQCPIVIACDHRWWEYGTAIQILWDNFKSMSNLDILDVGSGWSGLGPCLALTYNLNMTEYEPVAQYRNDRTRTNDILKQLCGRKTFVHDIALETMPAQDYHAVFCISVLEHVNKATEKQSWKELANRVRPGGVMFVTCDVVEDNTVPHIYDEMRVMPNYTMEDMFDRVAMVCSDCNMETIGTPDYTYNGNQIHDFTFFRAGFRKKVA